MTQWLYVVWILTDSPPPHVSYSINCLWDECIARTLRKINNFSCRSSTLWSILLDTGRGIGTETCKVDNVFPQDCPWFRSYTEHELCYHIYFPLIYLFAWRPELYIFLKYLLIIAAHPLSVSSVGLPVSQSTTACADIVCLVSLFTLALFCPFSRGCPIAGMTHWVHA